MASPSEDAANSTSSLRSRLVSLRQVWRVFFIGILMGSADAVPGVSGGTVALIVGVYDRLIAAVTAITPRRLIKLVRAIVPFAGGSSATRAVEILDEIDAWFVLVLLTGIGTAVVIVGQGISYAEARAPITLFGLFFGLIAASAVILLREIVVDSLRCWLAAIAGFSIAFVLSGGVQLLDGDGLAIVFVAGSIAVSAMILPGISGSLLLIILGQYIPMYSALNEFLDGIGRAASGAGIEAIVGPGAVVVTFLLGGLVGLFTIARLIRRMLETYRKTTLAFLVGLIVGALRAPITELSSREGFTWTAAAVSQFVVVAAIGAIFVLALDRYAVNIDLNTL